MKKPALFLFLVLFLCSSLIATDWYVRPTGGTYGVEDGTSYADAWDGLDNIVWGVGGVVAGDTLYVCGCHKRTVSGASDSWENWTISASGSSGNRIIIRGDSVSEAGEIWGAGYPDHEAWTSEGSNTWSIPLTTNIYSAWVFEDVSLGSHTLLTKATSEANCKATAGSYWSSDYAYQSKLFVHCTDGNIPTNRILVSRTGYNFNMDGRSYITWQDISFYCIYRPLSYTSSPPHSVHDMTWDTVTWWYGETLLINFKDTSYNLLFDSCNIAWAQNGISFCEETDGGGSEPHDWIIRDCTIHNMGKRVTSSDAHAVSVQGTYNGLIEGCEMYNCGTTICFYLCTNADIKDCTVRRNFIHDAHTDGGANGRGIAFNLGATTGFGSTGNYIYQNIINDCVDGIRWQFHDMGYIYNNVVRNASNDSYIIDHYNFEVRATFKNNISINPTSMHMRFNTNQAEGNYIINSDNNCWYPISGSQFEFNDAGGDNTLTLTQWQALSKSGCTFDPNSINTDPAFVNAGGSYALDTDFQIPTGSPCKDTGVMVGLGTCYFGVTIPSGSDPDIGAHEYDQGDVEHKMQMKPGTRWIVLPGGKIIKKEPEEEEMLSFPPKYHTSWENPNIPHSYTREDVEEEKRLGILHGSAGTFKFKKIISLKELKVYLGKIWRF